METLLALLAGVLVASGVYLLLERSLLRFVFGFMLLSNGVNLVILGAGRVVGRMPPLTGYAPTPPPDAANPLPQALVLTAIVIGFGLAAFTLALLNRGFLALGTLDADDMSDDGLGEDRGGDEHLFVGPATSDLRAAPPLGRTKR
jgi:multicomponent Na+:H+ antiporter subunit C